MNGTSGEWINPDGTTEPCTLDLDHFTTWKRIIECTTEAEARRVAGFPEAST